MLISFVIPVYNVEKYLSDCLESILNQDCRDYEILLVDDGSTDSSGNICEEYAGKYSNISVIHQKNGGLSEARNTGIKNAKGKYILFVDSDDYIGKGSLKEIVSYCDELGKDIDVMFLEAYKVFPDYTVEPLGDGYVECKINGKSKQEVMQHLCSLPKYPGSACTKLVRRDLIIQNSIYFESGLLSEDLDWTIRLLKSAKKFGYCPVKYYFYRQCRFGSITNSVSKKNVSDLLYILEKWSDKNQTRPYQNEINAFMAYEYMVTLYNYGALKKESKKELEDRIKRIRWIIYKGKTRKTKIIAFLIRLLGVNMTAYLLQYLH